MPRGNNLPDFRACQLEFAAHLRDPEAHPPPADVDPRRMQVYARLVYNNVESFLARAFPVAKQVLGDVRWHALARDFLRRHPSGSPYFREIPQEFLAFLDGSPPPDAPPFLLELCHYEWVEMWLAGAPDPPQAVDVDAHGDLYNGVVVVSPLIWKLSYRYPVHRVGPEFQPEEPDPVPTQLVVYRREDLQVRFMAVNAVTMALLDELAEPVTGARALERLAQRFPQLEAKVIREKGLATLERLHKAGVLLGIKRECGE